MLTDAAARAAGARSRAYKLIDQGGLHLLVRPTGTKSWRQKYRWRGREKLLTLGQFPEVSVARARILQAEAKDSMERGIDPARQGSSKKTLEQLGWAWYRANLPNWSTAHAEDVLSSLERDIFPALGDFLAREITSPDLLNAVRAISDRGCEASAHRVRQRLAEMFAFGKAEGLVDRNPAADLGAAMRAAPPSRPFPALVSIDECRECLADCEADRGRVETIMAARFLALTGVRLSAVRGARWEEVDLEERIWTVPASRMKLSKAKKGEGRFDHLVTLNDAALFVLRGIGAHDKSGLIFRGRSGAPIGESTFSDLYVRAGYSGRHVPHGWRASFSTILNEDLGPDWRFDIDAALGHAGKGKVEAAYNRSILLDRRRHVFDRWGELLSGS